MENLNEKIGHEFILNKTGWSPSLESDRVFDFISRNYNEGDTEGNPTGNCIVRKREIFHNDDFDGAVIDGVLFNNNVPVELLPEWFDDPDKIFKWY